MNTHNITYSCPYLILELRELKIDKKDIATDVPANVQTESRTESRFSLHGDALPGRHGNVDTTSLTANPDIRVPDAVTIEDGLCARRVVEEEEDAETAEKSQRGGFGKTEETSNKREAPHPSTKDRIETKEEIEERELRHVPGGTWLNQVRTFLKDSFCLKGRGTPGEERGGRLQGEGKGFIGRGEEERNAREEE
ncbi:hypothetical protein NDU88_001654 [Pleurodeles waltl]|uniref:Uncharacterized protein n=1 Tax=Pleurodeles waltl TaxID=8319 RepID=A0AAV7TKR9_PLEWA|nr:hypothetical protein NDU88_001654 [Pleurodeles waltl]